MRNIPGLAVLALCGLVRLAAIPIHKRLLYRR